MTTLVARFTIRGATIANPRELAETLTGAAFELIDRNGAPAGEKIFAAYNPPVVNRQLGIRRSYINESRRMAMDLIDAGQQTLVFANNRLATELLVTYLRDACDNGRLPSESVRGYRGGYTAVTDQLRQLRPAPLAPFEVRFETPPGTQAQVDFAQFQVVFTDEPAVIRIVWLFSLVLGFVWGLPVVHAIALR